MNAWESGDEPLVYGPWRSTHTPRRFASQVKHLLSRNGHEGTYDVRVVQVRQSDSAHSDLETALNESLFQWSDLNHDDDDDDTTEGDTDGA
jgi:hypothetical protein